MTATPAPFLNFLAVNAAEHGQATEAYTGAAHKHYGVGVPTMRVFVKEWARDNRAIDYAAWCALLDALYAGESVEERIFAGLLLESFPKHRRQVALDQLEAWLDRLDGWMEVDATAQSVFTTADLLARWDEWLALLHRLIVSANINQRRAGLVLLVLPIRESDDARIVSLAQAQIDAVKAERDILITKAVSWLLREGIKRYRDAIAAYVNANRAALAPIVVREVSRKLETGRK